MRPSAEQILSFEPEATAKGVPLCPLISCLPDGCDDEDTIYVLARASTKSEARELVPHLMGNEERAMINHAMVITLAIFMPSGQVLTGGDIVQGVNNLHDWSERFIPAIVNGSVGHLGMRGYDEIYSEVISPRTTAGDVAKFELPASVLGLRERYGAPGALRMVRADGLPSVVLTRPTGDADLRFDKAARGNRMWGAYIDHARAHLVYPDTEEAKSAIFEATPGYALPLVGVLQKMRSGGAREEGKGGPKPSAKRGG